MHELAGLSCVDHNGPESIESASDVVYWSNIPSDAEYKSPFYDPSEEKYLTFEPDHGGWNNIRMSMETVLVMAVAMGRTLVLPPDAGMYLLRNKDKDQKSQFSFKDFFHLDMIHSEHKGFHVITMDEFLLRQAMTGECV
uniref:O-fucosyltransferase family protein n=1 Tax=Ditylum brightwellii TaxID=49249 RepID=A0A7S4W364_9STRA